ncbi:MAG: branched-chain alpha-keto acid dehydrogenase subunit E2, partial [FCB group bacterium]|nr:branched-chain alpha-keto acid dehydrogenase subunit E2 [FCB group bacterium]
MIKVIKLPDLGEGIEDVDISEVQVSAGDTIAVDDILIILESEKATMEIPSEYAGTVKAVHVTAGDTLKPGSPIIDLDVEGLSEAEAEPEPSVDTTPTELPARSAPPTPTHTVLPPSTSAHASPGVRRLARELDIDLSLVPRTGPKGRLTKDDLLNYIKDRLSKGGQPTQPEIDFSAWGPVEEIPLNKIRRLTGERMQAAWQTVPHVTQFDRADITELEALRQSMKTTWAESGVRITLLPFLMKAVALLLKDYPDVNSSLTSTGKALILKKYIHLGIAVDTPEGLMVPVIRDVDQKDVVQLSRELMDVSERARSKKLKPDEFQGATFTISSLGGIGGTWFSPIVNPPQVAILGVSRASVQPVWDSKKAAFIPRTILP